VERVFLALGESSEPSRSWPDALSAGALAARLHAPILLIRTDEIPESVISALADLDPGVITVLGGPVAISEAAAARAGASVPDAQLNRLAGENRYGTSVQIAAEARRIGMDGRIAWLATGQAFPDALAAGPAAALADAPLVLIDGLAPGGSPFTDAWLAEVASSLDGAIVVGGTAAITDPVREEVARIIGR
jgi:putative cell wall-binding protein